MVSIMPTLKWFNCKSAEQLSIGARSFITKELVIEVAAEFQCYQDICYASGQ